MKVLEVGFSGGVGRRGGDKGVTGFGFRRGGARCGRAAHVLFAGVFVNLVIPTGVMALEQRAVQKQAAPLAFHDVAFDFGGVEAGFYFTNELLR